MSPNPFARRAFRKDAPVNLLKMPEAPVELEKYKPYLVQRPTAPDMPTAGRAKKVVVEKIVEVPSSDNDGAFN